MAFLYIAEYAGLCNTGGKADVLCFQSPPLREQTVANAGASTASLPFLPTTKWVEVSTDSVCSIAFAASSGNTPPAPVATTANMRLAAGERHVFHVSQGYTPSAGGYPPKVLALAVFPNT